MIKVVFKVARWLEFYRGQYKGEKYELVININGENYNIVLFPTSRPKVIGLGEYPWARAKRKLLPFPKKLKFKAMRDGGTLLLIKTKPYYDLQPVMDYLTKMAWMAVSPVTHREGNTMLHIPLPSSIKFVE